MTSPTDDQLYISGLQNKLDSSFTLAERTRLRASITNILNTARTFEEITDFYFEHTVTPCVSKRRLFGFFDPNLFQTNTKQHLLKEAQRNIYELLVDIKSNPNKPKRYRMNPNSMEDGSFINRLKDFYTLPRFFYQNPFEMELKIQSLALTFSNEEVRQINLDMATQIRQTDNLTGLRALYAGHMDKPYITGHRSGALNLINNYYYTDRRKRAIKLFRERAFELINQQYRELSTLNFNQGPDRARIAKVILDNIALLLAEDYCKSRHDSYDWFFNTTNTQPIDGILAIRRAIYTMPPPGASLPLVAIK